MTTDIILPILGESISEAVIIRWLKPVGVFVKRGEEIAEIETAKATLMLECPADGILLKILVEAGVTVKTGDLLAVVGYPGETPKGRGEDQSIDSLLVKELPSSNASQEELELVFDSSEEQRVSPAARRLAKELGIEVDQVSPKTRGARITTEDIEQFATDHRTIATSHIPFHYEELSETRKIVAHRMAESAKTIPQFSVSIDVEMGPFLNVINTIQPKIKLDGLKVTVTTLLAYMVGKVLAKHPRLNSQFEQDRIRVFDIIHLAVAVSTPNGLVAPVIFNLENQSLTSIARRLSEITNLASSGHLSLSDVIDSTFTLSNLGMYGVVQFSPLINPPQTAILGVGAIRPCVISHVDEGIRQAQLINLSVTADHRVLDGVDVAKFLATLKSEIEGCQIDQMKVI